MKIKIIKNNIGVLKSFLKTSTPNAYSNTILNKKRPVAIVNAMF
jgi:hypothetical protein